MADYNHTNGYDYIVCSRYIITWWNCKEIKECVYSLVSLLTLKQINLCILSQEQIVNHIIIYNHIT